MNTVIVESPLSEQEICLNCGLCCDGTLFSYADLATGEQGNLPDEIEQKYAKQDDYEYFALPCSYFCGKCTIYDQKKPIVCSVFRCQLLKNVSSAKITQSDAIKTVANALKFREEIYQLYKQIFGREYTLSFRELLDELSTLQDDAINDKALRLSIDLLKMKCTIYETLLIKRFKSIKNFERMITVSED